MNLLSSNGVEVADTITLNGVLDNYYVPMWRVKKFKDLKTLTLRHYTEDEVQAKKREVIEWATSHPNANMEELKRFMRLI